MCAILKSGAAVEVIRMCRAMKRNHEKQEDRTKEWVSRVVMMLTRRENRKVSELEDCYVHTHPLDVE